QGLGLASKLFRRLLSGSLVDPAHRPIDLGGFHASFLLGTWDPRLGLSILNLKPWSQWSLVLLVRLRSRNHFRGSRRLLVVKGQRYDVEVSERILASTHGKRFRVREQPDIFEHLVDRVFRVVSIRIRERLAEGDGDVVEGAGK